MSGLDLVQLARNVAAQELAPLRAMLQDGVVVAVEGDKAAVRTGGPTAPAVSGWQVPPHLDPAPGDHVLVYRLGGYQLVLVVLNRNALVGIGGGTVTEGGAPNLDGGGPSTSYGGTTALDGGTP